MVGWIAFNFPAGFKSGFKGGVLYFRLDGAGILSWVVAIIIFVIHNYNEYD